VRHVGQELRLAGGGLQGFVLLGALGHLSLQLLILLRELQRALPHLRLQHAVRVLQA